MNWAGQLAFSSTRNAASFVQLARPAVLRLNTEMPPSLSAGTNLAKPDDENERVTVLDVPRRARESGLGVRCGQILHAGDLVFGPANRLNSGLSILLQVFEGR